MGKHFSATELDRMHKLHAQGVAVTDILSRLSRTRARLGQGGPDLTSVRRALKGRTFKRGRAETRGRPRRLTRHNLRSLDKARMRLVKKMDGDGEVHWEDVIRAARVPLVDRTTASKALRAAGYDIRWRNPRTKPPRSGMDEAHRAKMCDKLRKLPDAFWTEKVDAYIDCKRWSVPRNLRGHSYLNKLKVRGHLRTPAEGLKKGFTKPDKRKHRRNVGPLVNVFAAIVGNRIRIWHYLPKRWGGVAAEAVYRKVLAPALKRHRGAKRTYTILEDNDPTGFKATPAVNAKEELKIQPIDFPTYSPDLNPLDFAVWQEVEKRMSGQRTPKSETIDGFKDRLKRTAKSIPAGVVRKMLSSIKKRAQGIYECGGGNMPRD